MSIQDKLNRLADIRSHQDVINIHYDDLIATVLTDEIKTQLDDIEVERESSLEAVEDGIKKLTDDVKSNVLEEGESVKADFLHAVWAKGRRGWDGDGLDGYMVAHPEIKAFRSVGDPSVSIRVVK